MSGQPGRSGKRRDSIWYDALLRALKRREEKDPRAVEKLADRLIKKAEEGDMVAIKELADRLDGRPAQQIIHTGDADNPLQVVNVAAETLAEKLARLADRKRDDEPAEVTEH
jgi:hypothetical protein